jgi:hypothetical protein
MVQLSRVFSITGFHPAVQQTFRMMDALHEGKCFATVRLWSTWQNLAWSSYLEFTASLVHPTALIKKKIKFSSYIGKSEKSSCKVIYEEGLPDI